MATSNSTLKVRSKSAAARIDIDAARTVLDAQTYRIFQARAIVQSVRAVLDDQDEGCDSWYALDVVQETLKEIAAEIDQARGSLVDTEDHGGVRALADRARRIVEEVSHGG